MENTKFRIIKIYIMRGVIRILHIFPIKQNRIIFNSYGGVQYACNPRYISEKLCSEHKEYEIIWAFKNPKKFEFLKSKGIKLVKYNSLKRFYYESTAKISINNIGSFSWIPIRKGQEHVNTWHSGLEAVKCALNEKRNDSLMKKSLQMTTDETSLFLSPNRFFSEYASKEQFNYNGKMLEFGLPRTDVIINDKELINIKVRKELSIDSDTVVVIYGPTWRYGGVKELPIPDFEQLEKSLSQRFGDNYRILKRIHHANRDDEGYCSKHVVDVTKYPSVQELITTCNVLITDYSSLMWDASFVGAYIILYTPDIEKYENERGFNRPLSEWGFPIIKTQKELNNELQNIDFCLGKKRIERFHDVAGNYETGHATDSFIEWMKNLK